MVENPTIIIDDTFENDGISNDYMAVEIKSLENPACKTKVLNDMLAQLFTIYII